MRIISGIYRGTTIYAPAGARTRPTADKVRGAIFSMLGPVEGLEVLDLFAGSGALGLEALSRGAATATLVENQQSALRALARNVEKLGTEEALVRRRDYRSFLREAARKGLQYDLIFIDPPYRMLRAMEPELASGLPGLVVPGGRVVVESEAGSEVSLPADLEKDKVYGDTRVRIFAFPLPKEGSGKTRPE